jgi:hypothetical protein
MTSSTTFATTDLLYRPYHNCTVPLGFYYISTGTGTLTDNGGVQIGPTHSTMTCLHWAGSSRIKATTTIGNHYYKYL